MSEKFQVLRLWFVIHPDALLHQSARSVYNAAPDIVPLERELYFVPVGIQSIGEVAVIAADHSQPINVVKPIRQALVIFHRKLIAVIISRTPALLRIRRSAVEKGPRKVNPINRCHVVAIHNLEIVANLCSYLIQLFDGIFPAGNALASLRSDLSLRHVPAFILTLRTQSEKGLPNANVEPTGPFQIG